MTCSTVICHCKPDRSWSWVQSVRSPTLNAADKHLIWDTTTDHGRYNQKFKWHHPTMKWQFILQFKNIVPNNISYRNIYGQANAWNSVSSSPSTTPLLRNLFWPLLSLSPPLNPGAPVGMLCSSRKCCESWTMIDNSIVYRLNNSFNDFLAVFSQFVCGSD